MSAKFDFKTLDTGFTAEWPVKVNIPVDGGKIEVQEFIAVFRTPTPEEAADQKAIEDYLERGRLSVRTGFIALGKDEADTLSDALKEKLLNSEWTQLGLMKAYGEFRSGSPAKN